MKNGYSIKSNSFLKILFVFLFAIALFGMGTFFVGNSSAKIFAAADTQEPNFVQNDVSGAANLTYSIGELNDSEEYVFTDNTSLSYTKEYDGKATKLRINVDGVSVDSYQWYYTSATAQVAIANGNTNILNIKEVKETGKYHCQVVYEGNQVVNSNEFEFNVDPKQIVITGYTAVDREFDNTLNVQVNAEYTGVLDGDNVSVSANGVLLDANVGTNKYITVTSSLVGDYSNYSLVRPTNITTFVTIKPLPVEIHWVVDNAVDNTFTYTGEDLRNNVKCYYEDISGTKVYPSSYTIVGSYTGADVGNPSLAQTYSNQFINKGTYTFTAILTQSDNNYEIKIVNGVNTGVKTLEIARASGVITIDEDVATSFVYTGAIQDASICASINNNEQTMTFANNLFTTVAEGNSLTVVASAVASLNYTAVTKNYAITVERATSNIDVSGVVKQYTYDGTTHLINKGAVIDNNEQTLQYTNNSFKNVVEGNNLIVKVTALQSANYKETSVEFPITVAKADIDTSTLSWSYGGTPFIFNGDNMSVYIRGFNPSVLNPYRYYNATYRDAGTYFATVDFRLTEPDNYNEVFVEGITWQINKAKIDKPNTDTVYTNYDGTTQTLSIAGGMPYYSISGASQQNAGIYNVNFAIVNNRNVEWTDGTTDNLIKIWVINKAKVQQPTLSGEVFYNGSEQEVNIAKSRLYTILNPTATSIGDHTSYVVLNDSNNYEWENTTSPYLVINWKILSNSTKTSTTVVLTIVLPIITLIFIAAYITLHFTVVMKRRRARKNASVAAAQKVSEETKSLEENKNILSNEGKQSSDSKANDTKDVKTKDSNEVKTIKTEEKKSTEVEKSKTSEEKVEKSNDEPQKKTGKRGRPAKKKPAEPEGPKTRKPRAKSRRK